MVVVLFEALLLLPVLRERLAGVACCGWRSAADLALLAEVLCFLLLAFFVDPFGRNEKECVGGESGDEWACSQG